MDYGGSIPLSNFRHISDSALLRCRNCWATGRNGRALWASLCAVAGVLRQHPSSTLERLSADLSGSCRQSQPEWQFECVRSVAVPCNQPLPVVGNVGLSEKWHSETFTALAVDYRLSTARAAD